jgi:hypothetical protein
MTEVIKSQSFRPSGIITGIIIDDPLKNQDISEKEQDCVRHWYETTLKPLKHGDVIFGSWSLPWCNNDLATRILNKEGDG